MECYYIWDLILTALSIVATLLISVIALCQNKKIKNLSDQKDEARAQEIQNENRLKIRPRFFISYTEIDSQRTSADSTIIYVDDLSNKKVDYSAYTGDLSSIDESLIQGDTIADAFRELNSINRFLRVRYTIRNVGAGSATDISFTINEKFVPLWFALLIGETKTIDILFDFEKIGECNKKEIVLSFSFSDIEQNQYRQETSFMIYEKDSYEARKEHYTTSSCKVTEPKLIYKVQ